MQHLTPRAMHPARPRLARAQATLALSLAALAAPLALAIGAPSAGAASAGETILTSGVPATPGAIASTGSGLDSGGNPGESAVSQDGRYVAFFSDDDDLAPGAEPDVANLYRKDRLTGAVVLISRTSGAGGTGLPAQVDDLRISDDGNRVGWTSSAAFDPADVDGLSDVYIRDVAAQTTTLATPGTTTDVNDFDLSGDGAWIAFQIASPQIPFGDSNNANDIYRRNLATGAVELASTQSLLTAVGNGASTQPAISDDGRWVAFASTATNLTPGYTAGAGTANIFAHDMVAGTTLLISARFDSASTGANGSSSNPIIAGSPTVVSTLRVGYASDATNLSDNAVTDASISDSAYLRVAPGTTSTLLSRANGIAGANADSRAHLEGLSDDATRAVFGSDADNLPGGPASGYYGSWLRNITTGTTTLLSARNDYAVNPAISGDGSYAVWLEAGASPAAAPELSTVVGRATPSGAIELVSRPAGTAPLVAAAPSVDVGVEGARTVSADGRYVVFRALGAGLGTSEPAPLVYRRDLRTGALEVVSRASGPGGASAAAAEGSIDASGTRVSFLTPISLDPADTNASNDLYVRDLPAGTTTLVSRASGPGGAVSNAQVGDGILSADGQRIIFRSASTNFGVADGKAHLFERDLASATTTLVDRASGAAGAPGDEGVIAASISGSGRLVAFHTRSTNLSPDDAGPASDDIYLRDLDADTTTLLSRRPGLTGTRLTRSTRVALSSDGSTAAFVTDDSTAATEAGSYGDEDQIIVRRIATGANLLASRTPSGPPSSRGADAPSLSADGTVVAFLSTSPALLPGVGGSGRDAVFVKSLTSGAISGPPAFGLALDFAQQRALRPSISDDGQCVAFTANGHNAVTGKAGDVRSAYLYVASGSCPKPVPAAPSPAPSPAPMAAPAPVAPRLTGAALTNRRFAVGKASTPLTAAGARAGAPRKKTPAGTSIRFTLNTSAAVRAEIQRQVTGRRVGKQCLKATPSRAKRKPCKRFTLAGVLQRAGVGAGARSIAFSGRLEKKKLGSGRYQVVLTATSPGGSSAPVTLPFTIVGR